MNAPTFNEERFASLVNHSTGPGAAQAAAQAAPKAPARAALSVDPPEDEERVASLARGNATAAWRRQQWRPTKAQASGVTLPHWLVATLALLVTGGILTWLGCLTVAWHHDSYISRTREIAAPIAMAVPPPAVVPAPRPLSARERYYAGLPPLPDVAVQTAVEQAHWDAAQADLARRLRARTPADAFRAAMDAGP